MSIVSTRARVYPVASARARPPVVSPPSQSLLPVGVFPFRRPASASGVCAWVWAGGWWRLPDSLGTLQLWDTGRRARGIASRTNTCLLPVCDPAISTLHPHMYLKLDGSLHLAPQTGTVIALLSSVNLITICALSRNPPHVSSNELEIDFGK